MTLRHRIMTTSRVIYSLSKSKEGAPADIYEQIAQAIVGYEDFVPSENTIDYDQYIGMLD
jgi:hypothetical protein